MDYIYAKYKYSGRIKLIRMLALLAVVVGLFCVGIHKIFGDAVSLGFNVFAWLVLIIGALLVLIIGYLEIYRQSDIGKLYPVIALTIGIIFILIVPAFETPDEQDHFGSAYDLSNTWLGYGDPVSDGVAS
nr:hypothetical protein [Lachnospiraceae bacterium]